MTQDVIDTIKDGDAAPGNDIDHLVIFWATRIRATKHLTLDQSSKILQEFHKFMDDVDVEIRKEFCNRIIDESDRLTKARISYSKSFWAEPADTAIKMMGNSLATCVGVA